MKKLLILCAAIFLLSGCNSKTDAVPENQSVDSNTDYLPTAYARRYDDGSFAMYADTDSDHTTERINLAPANEDADNPDSGAVLSVCRDDKTIDSVTVDGFYPVVLACADLCPDDGYTELLISCDYASDDYVTSVYRFDGQTLVFCGSADGCVDNVANGTITLKRYDHPFGTWWLYGDYVLDDSGRTLSLAGDYSIRPEDYGWGQQEDSESGYYFPVLSTFIEARNASGTVTVERGNSVIPVRCDCRSYIDLLSEDGTEFRIIVRYINNDTGMDRVMVILPDGTEMDAENLFMGLTYWG